MSISDWITTNTSECEPITRESFEAGWKALAEYKPRPLDHIMHPRFEQGQWTRCTCGWYHRRINGELETGPIYADGVWSFPE